MEKTFQTVSKREFCKAQTGPKSRSTRRRSKAFGFDVAADCSKVVVLRWRSTYYQTPSKVRSRKLTGSRAGIRGGPELLCPVLHAVTYFWYAYSGSLIESELLVLSSGTT